MFKLITNSLGTDVMKGWWRPCSIMSHSKEVSIANLWNSPPLQGAWREEGHQIGERGTSKSYPSTANNSKVGNHPPETSLVVLTTAWKQLRWECPQSPDQQDRILRNRNQLHGPKLWCLPASPPKRTEDEAGWKVSFEKTIWRREGLADLKVFRCTAVSSS